MTKELDPKHKTSEIARLAHDLEKTLVDLHGPMLGGTTLSGALGYRTQAAFRQAAVRNTVPVPVFTIPKRKGKFALSREVARWMAEQRYGATAAPNGNFIEVSKAKGEIQMTR